MSIQGSLPLYGYSDYGVKLLSCRDDTGRELRLRSDQIFWMKGEFFELELDLPSLSAKQVTIDVLFATRGGTQRITKTLEIERTGRDTFESQSHRWSRDLFTEPSQVIRKKRGK